jgi:plasmid maintenance system killer protein
MKTNQFINAIAILNFVVLLFIAASPERNNFDKITVQEFELVDASGKQRASIKIEDGTEVVFRLRDADGNIRVKLGGNKDGSGLVLLDGETNPGVHVLAKNSGSTLTVLGANGKKKEF